MYWVLLVLYIVVSLLLLIVVLLQQGKGGDIAAAFGGASSQTAFGARAGATVLTRATAVLGTLFLIGAMTLARLCLPGMVERERGWIINIASLAGKAGPPLAETYAASKGGMIAFTQSLREMIRPSGWSFASRSIERTSTR